MGEPPLIVGAGPVGLTAALLLAQGGIAVQLIEEKTERSPYSKALAVNPRTLQLLKESGVTTRMLDLGIKIHGAMLHRGGKTVASIPFDDLHEEFPFMLALSQATTERLIAKAFQAAGGVIERGSKLVACRSTQTGAEADLETPQGKKTIHSPWLLGADGARSAVRQAMGIAFEGTAFEEDWHLVDVPLRTELPEDRAHMIFLEGGAFLFLVRAVDGTPGSISWRVLCNRPDPLAHLHKGEPVGAPTWVSSFHVAHRLASTLAKGNAYLAGDAAHIHSPVGARGMNLGIEDAWVFAKLALAGQLSEYASMRRPIDAAVVRRVKFLSKVASGESAVDRMLQRLMPLGVQLPGIWKRMRGVLAGLDHALPEIPAN